MRSNDTLVAVAVLTVGGTIVNSGAASGGRDLSDYALRHSGPIRIVAEKDFSDYALRHPGPIDTNSTVSVNECDYHQSPHCEFANVNQADSVAPDLSDYVLRHPGAMTVGVSVDSDACDDRPNRTSSCDH